MVQLIALLVLASSTSAVLADTDAVVHEEQWWCLGEVPCAKPTDAAALDGSAEFLEWEAEFAAADVIGAIQTDWIWKYGQTLPYSLCDARGCRHVGKVLATAQLTLNGEVQRSSMTARVTEGPTIKATLYRRCRATNGRFPDTTCAENTSTSADYRGPRSTYSITKNYETVDDGDYYYQFRWSWAVEGLAGTPSSGLGNSQTYNCVGENCRFP